MTGVTSIQFTPDQTRTLAGVSRGMMKNQGNPAFHSYAGKPAVWKTAAHVVALMLLFGLSLVDPIR